MQKWRILVLLFPIFLMQAAISLAAPTAEDFADDMPTTSGVATGSSAAGFDFKPAVFTAIAPYACCGVAAGGRLYSQIELPPAVCGDERAASAEPFRRADRLRSC